jgi:hypothetical protein
MDEMQEMMEGKEPKDEAKDKPRITFELDDDGYTIYEWTCESFEVFLNLLCHGTSGILEKVATLCAKNGNGETFNALSELYHDIRRAFGKVLELPEKQVKVGEPTVEDLTREVNW